MNVNERAGPPRADDGNAGNSQRRRRPMTGAARTRRHDAVREFQSDAIEIEESTPPSVARLTLYCVVALIFAAILWASLSRVDTIVSAQGKLTTTQSNLVLQPLETSVIRQMHVRAGDAVKRGDSLATLDPTFSQADLDQLRVKVAAFDAAIERLQAELDSRDYALADPNNPDVILQGKLFMQRKSFYATQLMSFNAQIASAKANLKTGQDDEVVLAQRLETMKSIESMRTALMDKEVGSRLNFLLSRDARLDVESNLSRSRGNQVDSTHKIDKAAADRQVFIEEFRRATYQELVETLAKRSGAAEDLKKAELRRRLIVLTAPADAVVLDVANRTVGSVVKEAETLFVLVPRNVPLQVEVNVEGRDIGQIVLGQSVRLKFEAFPFQKFGTGAGVVRVVSEDAFNPDSKTDAARRNPAPYYRVLVDVTDSKLRASSGRALLIPGMAVTAELKVGQRNVMSYFLYPLLRGLDESIREY